MKENWRYALSVLLFLLAAHARSSFAAPHDDAVMQADHSLIAALSSSDGKSAAKLLDAEFAWTDEQGRTRDKPSTLDDFAAFAAATRDDSVGSHFCGKLGFVYGTHHGARFVRIWVQRPKGWQLFVDLETPASAEPQSGSSSTENHNSAGDCDNHCRTLPFKPITAPAKGAVAERRKTGREQLQIWT
jgi:hypothetical protein